MFRMHWVGYRLDGLWRLMVALNYFNRVPIHSSLPKGGKWVSRFLWLTSLVPWTHADLRSIQVEWQTLRHRKLGASVPAPLMRTWVVVKCPSNLIEYHKGGQHFKHSNLSTQHCNWTRILLNMRLFILQKDFSLQWSITRTPLIAKGRTKRSSKQRFNSPFWDLYCVLIWYLLLISGP